MAARQQRETHSRETKDLTVIKNIAVCLSGHGIIAQAILLETLMECWGPGHAKKS